MLVSAERLSSASALDFEVLRVRGNPFCIFVRVCMAFRRPGTLVCGFLILSALLFALNLRFRLLGFVPLLG